MQALTGWLVEVSSIYELSVLSGYRLVFGIIIISLSISAFFYLFSRDVRPFLKT
jgi:hypothetical protein